MDRFGRWLARRPLIVVLANLAVTLVLGAWALQLRIENSLESMLPTADPKVEYYNATRAIFGSDDVGVVGVRAADIFAPDTIEKIARVTDALGKVPGVEGVVSITNVVDPGVNIGQTPPRLLPHIPPSPPACRSCGRPGRSCSAASRSRSERSSCRRCCSSWARRTRST